MNLFDLTPGGEYFCRPFAVPPTPAAQSVKLLLDGWPAVTHLTEGDARFEIYRTALLSSIERWLLYSTTNYRRALDMLGAASAPWAHVTLYYSSFFAANAILGMFGGFVKSEGKRTVVDVVTQAAGSQQFLITRKAPVPLPATGSHGVFWAYFYSAAPHITAWAPAALKGALVPPGSHLWQTDARNAVNYDMYDAFQASRHFENGFDPTHYPASITGNLGQQLATTENVLELASTFARELKLECFALDGLSPAKGRARIQSRLVKASIPRLVKKSQLTRFL
jgi:hypothetical protein